MKKLDFRIETNTYLDTVTDMVKVESIVKPMNNGEPFYVVSEIPMNKDLISLQEAKYKAHINTFKRYLKQGARKD